MRRLFRLGVGLLSAALLVGLVPGVAAKEVIVMDEGYAPFSMIENGQPAGLAVEIVTEAFHRMGVGLEIELLPWKRAVATAESEAVGIAGIYRNSERERVFDFSQPFYENRLGLFVLKNQAFPFQKLTDLKGKTLYGLFGWSYGDAVDAAVRSGLFHLSANSRQDLLNFRLLLRPENDVDGVIAVEESGRAALRALRVEPAVVMLPQYLTRNPVYLAYAHTRNRTDLIKAFDQAIQTMRADGSLDRIEKRFFATRQ